MAERTFRGMTTILLNESSTYPYDCSKRSIRGLSILSSAGVAVVTVKLVDGTSFTTPRVPEARAYEALYTKEVDSITSVSTSTTFDLELLEIGLA